MRTFALSLLIALALVTAPVYAAETTYHRVAPGEFLALDNYLIRNEGCVVVEGIGVGAKLSIVDSDANEPRRVLMLMFGSVPNQVSKIVNFVEFRNSIKMLFLLSPAGTIDVCYDAELVSVTLEQH